MAIFKCLTTVKLLHCTNIVHSSHMRQMNNEWIWECKKEGTIFCILDELCITLNSIRYSSATGCLNAGLQIVVNGTVIINVEQLLEWEWSSERKYTNKSLPQCRFSHQKSHITWHDNEERRRGGKPTTNHLYVRTYADSCVQILTV
jgi:hypothetical protein